METIADRIRYIREQVLALKQEGLATLLKVKRQSVTNWERGEPIGRKNAEKICELVEDATLDWLLHGRGDPPRRMGEHTFDREGERISLPGNGIREIDVTAGLGGGQVPDYAYKAGAEVTDSFKRESWVLPASFMRSGFRAPASAIIAMSTQGDSMSPTISHGDVAFVDTRHTRISPPGIYAIRDIYGEIIIKRIEAFKEGEEYFVTISSDNPAEPRRRERLSEVAVVGRVCGIMKTI